MQAAREAGDEKLEGTLVNNLGTVLRQLRHYKRGVALHTQQLARVERVHGLHSAFLILARHNLVDILATLHRFGEAEALLVDQGRKLEALVAASREAAAAGRAGKVHGGVTPGAHPRVPCLP